MQQIDYITVDSIVKKLMGDVIPTGDTILDDSKIKNINEYGRLIRCLTSYIGYNLKFTNRHEFSVQNIVRESRQELLRIKDVINDILGTTE